MKPGNSHVFTSERAVSAGWYRERSRKGARLLGDLPAPREDRTHTGGLEHPVVPGSRGVLRRAGCQLERAPRGQIGVTKCVQLARNK